MTKMQMMKPVMFAAALLLTGVGAASAENRFISRGQEARIQQLLPGADTTNVTGGQSYIIDQIFMRGPDAEYHSDLDRRNALRILFSNVPGGLPQDQQSRGLNSLIKGG